MENAIIGNLSTYVYIPPVSQGTIDSAGNSTKFAAIMLLLFNLGLKILLKSAMSFIWDLVHILQVFRYEILLNIAFPWNVIDFGKLMKFANGDVEEINNMIPDIVAMIFDFE